MDFKDFIKEEKIPMTFEAWWKQNGANAAGAKNLAKKAWDAGQDALEEQRKLRTGA